MKSNSIPATPDIVSAALAAMAGPWLPGVPAACGPWSEWMVGFRPAPATFSKSTASSTDAARKAILSALHQSKQTKHVVLSTSAMICAGMPVYLPIDMNMTPRNRGKLVIAAATRTVTNLKETLALNPRLSVFAGG